jgi:hypothetical protein
MKTLKPSSSAVVRSSPFFSPAQPLIPDRENFMTAEIVPQQVRKVLIK